MSDVHQFHGEGRQVPFEQKLSGDKINARLSSSLFFQIESWRRGFVDDVSLLIAVGLLSQTQVGF
jgi:hypothetical protein